MCFNDHNSRFIFHKLSLPLSTTLYIDFAGNPLKIVTSLRTGLCDFVLQPSRELKHITKDPSRVVVGVSKGTLSLASNSGMYTMLLIKSHSSIF